LTSDFDQKNAIYNQVKLDWDSLSKQFNHQKDSLNVLLTDSLKSADSVSYFSIKKLADSTLSTPDFSSQFPFVGSYWDSTRAIFQTLRTKYSTSKEYKRFEKLIQEIQLPAALKAKPASPAPSDSTNKDIKP